MSREDNGPSSSGDNWSTIWDTDFAESARAWNASGSEFGRQIEAVGRAAGVILQLSN